MSHIRSPRALIATVALVFAIALALFLPALPGDAESRSNENLPADVVELLDQPESAPPADAEQVLGEAQVQAFTAEVEALAAEQQRLADEAAALEELAAAQAAADAELAALAAAATEAQRAEQVGVPADEYWDRMAYCETGGDWGMTGSRYSGGVGFYNGTWDAWGGREFAQLAGQATREQQIIVANRVATQGYQGPRGFVDPVGYSGWGCVKKIGYP
jgi:multidrug efflux pump subunit AcrA (membrane-fusion protein)